MPKDYVGAVGPDKALEVSQKERARSSQRRNVGNLRSAEKTGKESTDSPVIRKKNKSTESAPPTYNSGGQVVSGPTVPAATPSASGQSSTAPVETAKGEPSVAAEQSSSAAKPAKRRERIQLEIGRELGYTPKENVPVVAEEKKAATTTTVNPVRSEPATSDSFQSLEQQLEQFFGEQALSTI